MPTRRGSLAKSTPAFRCAEYVDFRELLEKEKAVDAVLCATPDHVHAPVAIAAMKAGKHVYCEKPLSHYIWEGRQMVNAARKYNRIVQVGSQQRSMWPNRVGCELVRTGRIGKIQRVIAHNYPSPWEGALPAEPVPRLETVPRRRDIPQAFSKPGWRRCWYDPGRKRQPGCYPAEDRA